MSYGRIGRILDLSTLVLVGGLVFSNILYNWVYELWSDFGLKYPSVGWWVSIFIYPLQLGKWVMVG
jgi:hypothetical protein